MKLPFKLSLFLVLAFALSGCASEDGVQLPPPAISRAAAPASTSTTFPAPAPTDSLFTATPSFTVTPTLVDTLEPVKVTQTLQPLFEEPMNCAVPCFWGIIPGKTHLDEAKTFFSRLGFRSREGKGFYSAGYKSDRGGGFSLTLYGSGLIVENIELTPYIVQPKEGSPREWIAYSPETLIKRYGKPSRVEFAVGLGPNIGIDMLMYFDEQDLIVHYSGYNMTPSRFCPLTAPFDFVRLWLGPNPPDTPSFETVSLEKATTLTIDQFAHLMMGDPQTACFALNDDAFR